MSDHCLVARTIGMGDVPCDDGCRWFVPELPCGALLEILRFEMGCQHIDWGRPGGLPRESCEGFKVGFIKYLADCVWNGSNREHHDGTRRVREAWHDLMNVQDWSEYGRAWRRVKEGEWLDE